MKSIGIFKSLGSIFNSKKQENIEPVYLQYSRAESPPIILVTLLSTDMNISSSALVRHANKKGYRVVFVVTNPDVHIFQVAGCTFEYLPSPEIIVNMADAGDWQSYLQERWNMINSKWSPRWTIEYGISIEAYLNNTL